MRQLPSLLLILAISLAHITSATINCETPCGNGNKRIQICHFNGLEFQTLCIRPTSVLRKPQNHHASAEDYCGPCTTHKPFETTQELRGAVAQYVSHTHYDVELATAYGWPINQWNVSLISDFSQVFANHKTINEDLSEWDTSAATNMAQMFWHCSTLENGGIGRWDTSRVTDMERLFEGASKFNGDLDEWDTRQVTNLMGTFWRATQFNQELSLWDTSKVTAASRLFAEASKFDQDLSGWDTTRMRDLSFMFLQATSFSQDISEWDLSNAITLERMLYKVPAYESSVARQDALLTAWKRQWATAGRLIGTVNTEDMFSCPEATSYMRGGKSHILHLKTTSTYQPTAPLHSNKTEDQPEELEASTNETADMTNNSTVHCAPGVCPTQ